MEWRKYVQVPVFEAALVLLEEVIQSLGRSAQGHPIIWHGSTNVKLLVLIFTE